MIWLVKWGYLCFYDLIITAELEMKSVNWYVCLHKIHAEGPILWCVSGSVPSPYTDVNSGAPPPSHASKSGHLNYGFDIFMVLWTLSELHIYTDNTMLSNWFTSIYCVFILWYANAETKKYFDMLSHWCLVFTYSRVWMLTLWHCSNSSRRKMVSTEVCEPQFLTNPILRVTLKLSTSLLQVVFSLFHL